MADRFFPKIIDPNTELLPKATEDAIRRAYDMLYALKDDLSTTNVIIEEGGDIGPGTINTLAKFTATDVVGDSIIKQDSNKAFIHTSGFTSNNPAVQSQTKGFSILKNLTDATANEWGFSSMIEVPSTSSSVSYQKSALMAWALTADPSNYGSAITRDVTGIDARGIIKTGISNGRAWGIFAEAASAGDGFLVGIEVAVSDGTSDQADVDTTTTKVGIAINTGVSSFQPTAASIVTTSTLATAVFHHGHLVKEDAVSDDAFAIIKTGTANQFSWRVKPTGQTLLGDLNNGANTGNYSSTNFGTLVVRSGLSITNLDTGAAANKHYLFAFSDDGTSAHRFTTALYGGTSTWPITFETNGTEALRITSNSELLVGFTSTQYTVGAGAAAIKGFLYVSDLATNAHIAAMAADTGTSMVVFGTGHSGSATAWPIGFRVDSTDWLILQTDGGLAFTASLAAVSSASQGRIRYNSGTNKFQVSENTGAYVDMIGSGGLSGSGTTGTISKWSSSSALTNSALVETGSEITSSLAFRPTSDDTLDNGDTTHTWHKVWASYIQSNTTASLRLLAGGAHSVFLGVSAGDVWELSSAGHFFPVTNNTYTLGASGNRPSTVYGVAGNFSGTVTAANLSGALAASDISGTLGIANGGTNSTSLTSSHVMYFNGTSIVGSSNLTYNGTDLTMGTGNIFLPSGHGLAVTGGGGGFAVTSTAAEVYVSTSTLAASFTNSGVCQLRIAGTLYTLSVVAGIVNAT